MSDMEADSLSWVTEFEQQKLKAEQVGKTQSKKEKTAGSKKEKVSKAKANPDVGKELLLDNGAGGDIGDFEAAFEKTDGKKKLSVERIYQKKSQLEHILLRPDSYIGSVETVTQNMWVYDDETSAMIQREITFVPGLYKIFDEILVNAADNKQRDPNMNCIKIDIDPDANKIKIWNNGKGIPVIEHKTEKMYVPTLIFGHLLTSSNYDDTQKKVTGGRNGYGAKLCNIFSTKFIVETSCGEYKKAFKQTWQENMTKTKEPTITEAKQDDFTSITFHPDLPKFKMERLDKDVVDLFTRRAYDIAAASKGVKVFLNGKRLSVKNFKDYVELHIKDKVDEAGQSLKVVYEKVNERWEVAVTVSDKGFQQSSFVNSIATTKGGRHVDYVADQIVNKLIENVKKKNKGGVNVKPFQIRSHLWIFVSCLIENPTFDSQTKENMTLQMKSFGSKCVLTENFIKQVNKCGIVESILSWMKFKAQAQLNKKCHSSKHSKLKGIPKLDDANDAGTKNSMLCTLILTEGDSAKTLAVAGLSIVGRDRYGVFPLRGKVLNVREATHKQIMDNAEINNIIKIMGLQFKEKYDTMDEVKRLRYGKIMIMTDQDQDGSHIKGLLINFMHHFWPNLLKHGVIEEFITPIVKVSKAKAEKSFFSLPEFEEWKGETDNWHTWKIKYYKGLGTSTAKEAKEYFQAYERHRIPFKYVGSEDDASINLAFSKKKIEERKEWLTNWMDERKKRSEMGLPDLYLYGKETTRITYNEFINRELILFSNTDNVRSLPSLVDGFKPGQRKVMFTCFKRNLMKEIKVVQLAGSVSETSAYHHGEASLMSTIINLAQNFVGSNNLNLLQPIGQFGTRLHGGKDAASPRYIFTALSPLSRIVFNSNDDALMKQQYDDNLKIEPEFYCPIIPMVLANGADGIGTGWSTRIPNYDIREIVANIKRLLDGLEPMKMIPCFKDFKGTIDELSDNKYIISGEISHIDDNTIEISELPIRTWTQTYKEEVLEPMLHGTDKTPPIITDYKEYHTDKTVKFVVKMSAEKLAQAEQTGLHKVFKLQNSLSTTTMVLFDENGCLRRYDRVEDILKEFFAVRLKYYQKRKDYLEGMLSAESLKLDNIGRFIMEKISGEIVIENKPKKEIISMLVRRGYDSDPVKAWKETQAKSKDTEEEEEDEEDSSGPDFNYLLSMPLWNLTKEKKEELCKQRDNKSHELFVLRRKSPENLWEEDLETFLQELDRVEQQEREEGVVDAEGLKPVKAGKSKGKIKKLAIEETLPSPMGIRVVPVIDSVMKQKARKDVEKKVRMKEKKELKFDDDDLDISDGEDGEAKKTSPPAVAKKPRAKKASAEIKKGGIQDLSSSPKNKKKGKKGGKKKNPWSDSEEEQMEMSDLSDAEANNDIITPVRDRVQRRAAASKAKYTFDEEEESVESDDNKGFKPNNIGIGKSDDEQKDSDDEDSFKISEDEENDFAKENTQQNGSSQSSLIWQSSTKPTMQIESDNESDMQSSNKPTQIESDNESDMFGKDVDDFSDKESLNDDKEAQNDGLDWLAPKKETKKPPKEKKTKAAKTDLNNDHDNLDWLSSESEPGKLKIKKKVSKPPAEKKARKPKKKKNDWNSESDSEKPKKKAAKRPPKAAPDSDFSDEDMVPKKKKAAPKKKHIDLSDDDGFGEDDGPSEKYVPRATTGRVRKEVKYTFSDEEEYD